MDQDDLEDTLIRLKEEHRDLDDSITALVGSSTANQIQIQRLKKRKLKLKDQISEIEDDLLPDIIA